MADNFWDAYNSAYTARNTARSDEASRDAGNAFAGGNYTDASGILARSGDIAGADKIRQYGVDVQAQQAKDVADLGLRAVTALRALPESDRAGYLAHTILPQLASHPVFKSSPAAQQGLAQWANGPLDDAHLDSEAALLGQAQAKWQGHVVGPDLVMSSDQGQVKPGWFGGAAASHFSAKPDENVYAAPATHGYMPGQGPQPDAGVPAAAPAPAPAPATTPPASPRYAMVGQTAAQAGASPDEVAYLQRTAQLESGGRQNAVNGSSQGTFQFKPDTFYGLLPHGDINSAADQTKAAMLLQQRDRQTLQSAGIAPDDANTYIMHQQGAGGGLALLKADPNASAVATLKPVYRGNPAVALQAIAGNIGMPYKTPQQRAAANAVASQMTAGQFVGKWRGRWGGGSPAGSPTAPGPAQAPDTPTSLPGGFQLVQKAQTDPNEDQPLTPEAVDLMAGKFISTGVMPPLGMGKAARGDRVAILNRATEIAKSLGLSADDLVAGSASIKALGSALNKATTMRAQVEGSEQTVNKNLDFALSLAPKGVGHGPPVWNRFEQHLRGEYAGDPDVTSFDNALHTVADEYAKVMTTSTGTGGTGTSDSARNEAYRRLSTASTIDQLNANAGAMRTEMANRIQSLREVEGGLRANLRSGGRGGDAGTPASVAPTAQPAAAPHQWPTNGALDYLAKHPETQAAFEARFGPVTQYRRR